MFLLLKQRKLKRLAIPNNFEANDMEDTKSEASKTRISLDKYKEKSSEALEQADRRSTSSTSPTQQEELSSTSITKDIKFDIYSFFNIPRTETILSSFHCSLDGKSLTRGTLILLNHFLVFYTRFFQHNLGFSIALDKITNVAMVNTGFLLHGGVKISFHTEKAIIFTSLSSRNDIYTQIFVLWNMFRLGHSDDLSDCNQLVLETLKRTYHSNSKENSPKILYTSEVDTVVENVEEDLTINSMLSVSFRDPEDLIMYQKLPLSAVEFGEILASGDTPTLSCVSKKFQNNDLLYITSTERKKLESICGSIFEEFHQQLSHKGLECSKWYRNDKFGCTRTISYHTPIHHKLVSWLLGTNYVRISEMQRFSLSPDNSKLLIESKTKFLDVACKRCFELQTRMEVINLKDSFDNANDSGCIAKVFCRLQWKSRFLWFRSIFESYLREETVNSFYLLFRIIQSRWQRNDSSLTCREETKSVSST
eukprot:jgi/Galph1/2007/GphlegSOOS_G682.1